MNQEILFKSILMSSNYYPDTYSNLLSGYSDNTDICFSPSVTQLSINGCTITLHFQLCRTCYKQGIA